MADVELSWTDNSSIEDGFRIYRSTASSPSFPGDFSQIDSVGTDTTKYTDYSAPGGTTVTYAVTAFHNTYGESGETTDSVTTPAVEAVKYIAAPGEVREEQPAAGEVREEQAAGGEVREEQPVAGEVREEQPAPGDTDKPDEP